MRRALLAAAVLLALAGCGTEGAVSAVKVSPTPPAASSSSPTTSASAVPSPTHRPVPAPAGEAAYITQLEASGIIPRYGDAQGAVTLGRTICQAYDAGKTRADVIGLLVRDGMTQSDAGVTNAVAIVAFCPAFGPQAGGS